MKIHSAALTLIILSSFLSANKSIEIDISQQRLYVYEDKLMLASYPISSSSFGEGQIENSYKTPLGKHKILTKIGTNVEIGAKSAVDRGALGNTVIEDGVKIDNHVHVAHNSHIGENTAIAGQSGMAGSVKIGKNCQIAGQVGIVGHIEIVDNVIVMAKTLVTKSLKEPGVYSGVMPIQEHKDSLKFIAKIKK